MYPFILGILLLLFAWISWREPKQGLWLIAFALPSYLLRFHVLGIPSTFLEGMIVLLAFLVVLKQPESFLHAWKTLPRLWKIFIVGTLVVAMLAILPAPDLLSALGAWKAYFAEPILVFFLARMLLKSEQDLLHLIFALGCSALVTSLFAVAQWVFEISIPAPWDIERRVTSFFPYPNAVGLFLGPLSLAGIFAATRAWTQHKKSLLIFWIITLLLSGATIILAQSEAAILAVLITAFLLSLFSRFWRRITVPLFILATLLISLTPSVRTTVWQKLTLQDYSGSVRLTQWEETGNLLINHPLMGAGLTGYPEALKPYHTHAHIEIFQYPHNIFLNAWTELGLLGLVLLVFFGILLLRSLPRVQTTWICAMVLAVFAEMLIHGLVDVPYFKNDLSVLSWVFIALLLYDPQPPTTKTSNHL